MVNTRSRLGWDTMASINVASSLDMLENPTRIATPASAMGIGGIRAITHEGYCPKYKLKMQYIEGGWAPICYPWLNLYNLITRQGCIKWQYSQLLAQQDLI